MTDCWDCIHLEKDAGDFTIVYSTVVEKTLKQFIKEKDGISYE